MINQFAHIESLVLVTGMSGAGKSTAMAVLEDSGYFCIDNLPVPLLEEFLTLSQTGGERYRKTALLLDINSKESRSDIVSFINSFDPRPPNLTLIFFDADNPAIIRRYGETRRPHPGFDANKDRNLEDTIQRERSRLLPVKEVANFICDTSKFNVHALRRELGDFIATLGKTPGRTVRVNFLSFGFKYGIPLDCDLLADVRFLKNPFFVDELRELGGLDPGVAAYVLESDGCREFLQRYTELLNFLLPRYVFEGKAYVNIGIGCTGGKHRSVAIAQELSTKLNAGTYLISVKHRDLSR